MPTRSGDTVWAKEYPLDERGVVEVCHFSAAFVLLVGNAVDVEAMLVTLLRKLVQSPVAAPAGSADERMIASADMATAIARRARSMRADRVVCIGVFFRFISVADIVPSDRIAAFELIGVAARARKSSVDGIGPARPAPIVLFAYAAYALHVGARIDGIVGCVQFNRVFFASRLQDVTDARAR